MKRKIGFAALAVAGVSLLLWVWIVLTGSGFSRTGVGLNDFAATVFFSWIVSIFTAIGCLFGDLVRFVGKMFREGTQPQRAAAYCTACGKPVEPGAAFCPHCGCRQERC